ncbi:MAG: Na+/H+ antiporter [Candidatus Bipolaricaulia bacterium]
MIEITLEAIILLLVVASVVAVVVKYVHLPYTIALVIVGALIGIFGTFSGLELSKALILTVFLPPILFEGALAMDLDHLRENLRPVGVLAFFGTLISAFAVGAGAHYLLDLDWTLALLFGVIIAPTDPVSVIALFRELGLRRLGTIVAGESIFNDGLAVVLFGILIAVVEGEELGVLDAFSDFLYVIAVGAFLGLAFGYLAYRILGHIDDHLIEAVITLALAYGVFLLAETVDASGVIAVVLAGLIIGNYGRVFSMSPTTRVHLTSFWDTIVFIANSLLFLLIGIALAAAEIAVRPALFRIAVAIPLAVVGRALAVYPLLTLLNLGRDRIPASWWPVVFWGGLRGSIPVALVLGIGAIGVSRDVSDTLLTTVFGVVLFSLVVQGLTMKPLVRRLKLGAGATAEQAQAYEYEEAVGQEQALIAAIHELDAMRGRGEISDRTFTALKQRYEEALANVSQEIDQLQIQHEVIETEREYAERRVLFARRAALRSALERGVISEAVYKKLRTEIDRELENTEGRSSAEPATGDPPRD